MIGDTGIYYKEGYKYVLTRDREYYTGIMLPEAVFHEFFTLTKDGWCRIKHGFAWDGASGPTIDTKDSMRASAVHDCYCQAASERLIDYDTVAPQYHKAFYNICLDAGMWKVRAWAWHHAVIFGRGGHPDNPVSNPEQYAP